MLTHPGERPRSERTGRLGYPESNTFTYSEPSASCATNRFSGLEIAVDDALGVRRGEALASFGDVAHAARHLGAGALVDQAPEIRAAQELERHERQLADALRVREPDVVDGDHVTALDLGERGRLEHEARHQILVLLELRIEDLQRQLAAERGIFRTVHRAHATEPEQRS